MGVQRMLRGIFRLLGDAGVPVRWDYLFRRYSRLSARERRLLEDPFAGYRAPSIAPELLETAGTAGSLWDGLTRAGRGILPESLLGAEDTLLIPDVCWDRRVHEWKHLAAWPGRKVAYFHDAMPMRLPSRPGKPSRLFLKYMRELGRMDHVICVSREVEADLQNFWRREGVRPPATTVLPWPVPFSGAPPASPPNFTARRIIYVARLKMRKNQPVLLEACEQLWREGHDFSLELFGTADVLTDTLRILSRIRQLRARGRRVAWRRHVSDGELKQAYQECSFTVFPSKMEGFGLPVLESLWFGRPVICGRNGVLGEVSGQGGCLQIDQNNPQELATAMRRLLTDEDELKRLSQEARQRPFRIWADYGRDLAGVLGNGRKEVR